MATPVEIKAVALDAAEMGTWEWDPFSQKSVWDENMFRLTGISPDVVDDGATLLAQGMVDQDRQRVEEIMAMQIAAHNGSGERFRYEFRYRRPDTGEMRCLAARAITIRGDDQHIRLAGVMFDVTDFRRMQDELEEAGRAKTTLMATVAHELRSPLGAILNGIQILEGMPDKPAGKNLVQMLKRQAEHSLRLVEDLIDAVRAQQHGSMLVGHDRVNVALVVTRAVEVVEHVVVRKQHLLSLTVPEQPVFVDGDAGRLLQVMTNLLQNSARYTSLGGQIHVSLTADDHYAFIEVEDNGPGISPEVKDHLFELFVQGKVSVQSGGLGIGLALVKKIVEAHQGSIEHRAAVPQGTVFRITLPRRHRVEDPVTV